MSAYRELKEQAWRVNMDLKNLGLAIRTFGNASALDRARGVFAIKPSGVSYEALSPGNMVVVALEGRVVEGDLRPSSDTKTHALLYRRFEKIAGVVHTHSPFAVAWAQAGRPVPILGTTHADFLPVDVPCTKKMTEKMIRGDYEEETGNLILQTFRGHSYIDVPMVLVAGHGPFTWGTTPELAVEHSLMLEEIAKIAFLTLRINPATPRLQKPLIQKHYRRKHGPDSYYGQHE